MQFVLDFVKGVCKCLKKSINYICNGLQKIPDAGCFYCCKYFGKMSDGLGSIVGSCFPRPYTCCSAFTILIIATPVVWGAIGYLDGHKLNCKEPAQVGLIISSKLVL